MSSSLLRRSATVALAATAASALVTVGSSPASAGSAPAGALYTMTNDPSGNAVQRFDRAADGTLTPAGTYPTGGIGLAGLGGRQGAVELSTDESVVFAVNAGSATVSSLRTTAGGLDLVGAVPSGGAAPVSVDEHEGRAYVLNSGGTANVTAFTVEPDGSLTPIPGGTQQLPGAAGAAQVSVSPDGSRLVVTERLSNRLETLPLDAQGRPGAPVVTASNGTVPFGFAFGHRGDVVVSEAGASTVSSYRADAGGVLRSITSSLPVAQGAACWVAVSPNGRLAYTGNASGSISGFSLAPDGSLTALSPDGLTAALLPSPRDLDFTRSGRYLYAVSPGNTTSGGRVTGYAVASDGSLQQITSVPAAAGITGAAAA